MRLRAGPRRYRPIATGTAGYLGMGLMGAFGWAGNDAGSRARTWDAGLFGEMGAVYFVTRRLSLGAQVGLYGTFSRSYQRISSPPIEYRDRGVRLELRPVRILGGLYF